MRTRVKVARPVFRSIDTRISISTPYRDFAARAKDSSIASITKLGSIIFSRATASAVCKSSSWLADVIAISLPLHQRWFVFRHIGFHQFDPHLFGFLKLSESNRQLKLTWHQRASQILNQLYLLQW